MKTKEARDLGKRIAALVSANQIDEAHALLAPVLAKRTPFRFLGHIGEGAGAAPLDAVNAFLERIASERTEGGWVVIGKALGRRIWAYRKAAWTVDEWPQSVAEIYHAGGEAGLRQLPGIGTRLSGLIGKWLEDDTNVRGTAR